jgi:hypothetical protein
MAHDPIFARILRAFPDSVMDNDGSPLLRLSLMDAKGDPVVLEFDQNGAVEANGDTGFSHVLLSQDNLHTILRASRKAQTLMDKWFASEAGQAWAKTQNF